MPEDCGERIEIVLVWMVPLAPCPTTEDSETRIWKPFIHLRSTKTGLVRLPGWLSGKKEKKKIHLPMQQPRETQVLSLGWKDPLGEEMAIGPSILAWEIPWTEEPGRLQSME